MSQLPGKIQFRKSLTGKKLKFLMRRNLSTFKEKKLIAFHCGLGAKELRTFFGFVLVSSF